MRKRTHKKQAPRLWRRLTKKYPNRKLSDILGGGSKHAKGKTKPKGWRRALRDKKKLQRNARRDNR